MASKTHPHVRHPRDLLKSSNTRASAVNDWVTRHLALALGSMTGVYIALIVPLMALEIPLLFQVSVIVFSSWIQSWGLFSLQRTANRADANREAKENADHEALTHIALVVDSIKGKDNGIHDDTSGGGT